MLSSHFAHCHPGKINPDLLYVKDWSKQGIDSRQLSRIQPMCPGSTPDHKDCWSPPNERIMSIRSRWMIFNHQLSSDWWEEVWQGNLNEEASLIFSWGLDWKGLSWLFWVNLLKCCKIRIWEEEEASCLRRGATLSKVCKLSLKFAQNCKIING